MPSNTGSQRQSPCSSLPGTRIGRVAEAACRPAAADTCGPQAPQGPGTLRWEAAAPSSADTQVVTHLLSPPTASGWPRAGAQRAVSVDLSPLPVSWGCSPQTVLSCVGWPARSRRRWRTLPSVLSEDARDLQVGFCLRGSCAFSWSDCFRFPP